MQPYHNRLFCLFVNTLCPDIQILAVLIHRPVHMRYQKLHSRLILLKQRTHHAVRLRILDSLPRLYLFRSPKPLCIRIFNSLKNKSVIPYIAAELSGLCFYHRIIRCTYKFVHSFSFPFTFLWQHHRESHFCYIAVLKTMYWYLF